MGIEVEIKAWVDDFQLILGKLKAQYKFINDYEKEDVYLKGINSITKIQEEVRLRRVKNCNIVTYKKRNHVNKVEVNIEKEFDVDNAENFLYIMNNLGYEEFVTKSKRGFLFKHNLVNIELSHVKNLGDFIEIEYIVEHDSEVEEATNEILKILDSLNIPREKIEDKYYVEMIIYKKNGK